MSATQEHLLLVDDDPGITEHLSRILEKEGFRVTVVADGEIALGTVLKLFQVSHSEAFGLGISVLIGEFSLP